MIKHAIYQENLMDIMLMKKIFIIIIITIIPNKLYAQVNSNLMEGEYEREAVGLVTEIDQTSDGEIDDAYDAFEPLNIKHLNLMASKLKTIEMGKDIKNDVARKLGKPSESINNGEFNDWIYNVGETSRRPPAIIICISFDESGVVRAIDANSSGIGADSKSEKQAIDEALKQMGKCIQASRRERLNSFASNIKKIKVDVDTTDDVARKLGRPSNISKDSQIEVWSYIDLQGSISDPLSGPITSVEFNALGIVCYVNVKKMGKNGEEEIYSAGKSAIQSSRNVGIQAPDNPNVVDGSSAAPDAP